jgi:hypothetical protein
MIKIYNVFVTSNAYGHKEEHCGHVRAESREEAVSIGESLFSDSIRRVNGDTLDHLYATEWEEVEPGEPEPICENDPEPRCRTCGRVQEDTAVLECDECA